MVTVIAQALLTLVSLSTYIPVHEYTHLLMHTCQRLNVVSEKVGQPKSQVRVTVQQRLSEQSMILQPQHHHRVTVCKPLNSAILLWSLKT